MNTTLTFLALPSLVALTLLVVHTLLNRGRRQAALYFLAVASYGLARGRVIRWVTENQLGTPFPYLMSRPLLQLAQVSLQEIAGWALAVSLALTLGQRSLRRLGRAATPHRSAAAAFGLLVLLCLAVESAAIASSWWTWTLVVAPQGWLRVPLVALLDWGFVALDFLLPYLLWTARANWGDRLVGSSLFGLHMLGHTWVQPFPEPLPVAGNDLVHVGVLVYVLVRAVGEHGASSPAVPAQERLSWAPALAAAVVALASALAHVAAGAPSGAWASLPLLAVALASWRPMPEPAGGAAMRALPVRALRALVVAGGLAVLLAVRAPETRRQRDYVARLSQGVAQLNHGAPEQAAETLGQAIALRPDNPGGRTLLALTLLRLGRGDAARVQVEQALTYEPTARDALLLAIQLDLRDGQLARAADRAHLGIRAYPRQAEFVYLERVGRGATGAGKPAAMEAVTLARAAGVNELAGLAALARSLGDEATAQACGAQGR